MRNRRRPVDITDMSTLTPEEQKYYSHLQKRFREGGYLLYPRPNVLLPTLSTSIQQKEFIFNETVNGDNIAQRYNYNRSILKSYGRFPSIYYAGDTLFRTFSLVYTFTSDDLEFDYDLKDLDHIPYDSITPLSLEQINDRLIERNIMTAQDKVDCFVELINLRIPWCVRSSINGQDMVCEIEITDISRTMNTTIITKPTNGITTPTVTQGDMYSQDYITVTISCTEIDDFLDEDALDFPEIGIEFKYFVETECSWTQGYRGFLIDYDNSNKIIMTFSTQGITTSNLLTISGTPAFSFSKDLSLVSQSTTSKIYTYKKTKIIIEEKKDIDNKVKTFIKVMYNQEGKKEANLGFYMFNVLGNGHNHGVPMTISVNQSSTVFMNWNFPCVENRVFNINDYIPDIHMIRSVAMINPNSVPPTYGIAPTTIMYPIARINTASPLLINIFQAVLNPGTNAPYEYNTARG